MIKVLVVDDSSFMRKALSKLISSSGDIEVIGEAVNGKEGLELAQKLQPDIITLDIEMPVCDGLTMLETLMKTNPTPVLMVSSLTKEGAEATFKALDLGALDFISKYSDNTYSISNLQTELCEKIRAVSTRAKYMRYKFNAKKTATANTLASSKSTTTSAAASATTTRPSTLCSQTRSTASSTSTSSSAAARSTRPSTAATTTSSTLGSRTSTSTSTSSTTTSRATSSFSSTKSTLCQTTSATSSITYTAPRRSSSSKISYVGIGISTGGPPALQQVISALPENFPASVLIAQHMPAAFTPTFAQRLDKLSKVRVKEAEDGEAIESGVVYIAPGGLHMSVSCRRAIPIIRIQTEPLTEYYKPSANVLFESLSTLSHSSLAVIMTGMGSDGVVGLKTFKQKGGIIFAQDEESSTVYGMPKAAVEAGIADKVLSLDSISDAIINAVCPQ